jgi:molybdopterin-containing oxidoreductase family membrane subunit
MWFERFVIIVTSLHRDYLPSSWTMFSPTFVDIGIFIGTIGFFFVLFLLYARTFPVIAQAEVKSILKSSGSKFKSLRAAKGDDVKHYDLIKPGATAKVSEKSSSKIETTKSTFNKDQVDTLLNKLGTFDTAKQTADDLKKISGVGPVLEKKLNAMGLFTFDQVSRMTNEDYDLFDEIMGEFPGRAKRDDWAGQASKLKNN